MPKKPSKSRKAGRPTDYKPEYCARIIAYMRRGGKAVNRPTIVSIGNNQGSEIVDHPIGKLPAFLSGFATSIGVCLVTLENWAKAHEEFGVAYEMAKQIQLQQLLVGGLSGAYQQATAIFMLKNCHNWTDKAEVKHSGEIASGPLIYLPEGREPQVNGHRNGNGTYQN